MKVTRLISRELKKKEFDYYEHRGIQSIDQEKELFQSKQEEVAFDWARMADDFITGKQKQEDKHIASFPVKKPLPNHLEKYIDGTSPHITPTLLDSLAAVCALMLDGHTWWKSKIQRKIKLSPYMINKVWLVLIQLKIIVWEANHFFFQDQQKATSIYRLDELAMRRFLQEKGYL